MALPPERPAGATARARAAHKQIHRWNDEHRQQRRGTHAADHGRGNERHQARKKPVRRGLAGSLQGAPTKGRRGRSRQPSPVEQAQRAAPPGAKVRQGMKARQGGNAKAARCAARQPGDASSDSPISDMTEVRQSQLRHHRSAGFGSHHARQGARECVPVALATSARLPHRVSRQSAEGSPNNGGFR